MKFIHLFPIVGLMFFLIQCNFSGKKGESELADDGYKSALNKNYRSSIESYKKALEFSEVSKEEKAILLRNLGLAYHNIKLVDSSKYYFAAAANVFDTSSYSYLVNVSEIYIIDSQVEKATSCLMKAWEIDDSRFEVNNSLGSIFNGDCGKEYRNPQRALSYNLKADKIEPSVKTKEALAKNYYFLKDYEKAEKLNRDLFKQYPERYNFLMALIKNEQKQGKDKEADINLNILKQAAPEKYKTFIEHNQDK